MRTIRKSVFETNSSTVHSIVITKPNNSKYYSEEEIRESLLKYAIIRNNRIKKIYFGRDDLQFNRTPLQILYTFADKLRYLIASIGYKYFNDKNKLTELILQINQIIKSNVKDFKDLYYDGSIESIFIFDRNINSAKIFIASENKDMLLNYNYYEPICYKTYILSKKMFPLDLHKTVDDFFIYEKDGKIIISEKEILDLNNKRLYLQKIEYDELELGNLESYEILLNFLQDRNISFEEFLINKNYIVVVDGDEYNVFGRLYAANIFKINKVEEIYPENIDISNINYYDEGD